MSPPSLPILPTPLHPTTFAPYGTILRNPNTPHLSTPANQSTALKYPHISPLTTTYALAPSQAPATAVMSLFVCSPRKLRPPDYEPGDDSAKGELGHDNAKGVFDVEILERHPYTTQTFVPLSPPPPGPNAMYLVIVAPSLPSAHRPPDLANLRAFMARGGQGVTYGVGTWHAPMVVLGDAEVEFVVTQFENGVRGEDCEEFELGGKGIEVLVGERRERGREKL